MRQNEHTADEVMSDSPHPARWFSTNLVGVPAAVLASPAFQAHPLPLQIAGVRDGNGGLFALLESSRDAAQARERFAHYMQLAFGLEQAPQALPLSERRRWRTSWRRLLQGWGMDANGAAGAVLKGWAESRFGLVPVWHKAALTRFPSPAWMAYWEEKASPRWNNNSIWQQLDLLYEYAQWMQQHHALLQQAGACVQERHVVLWRGTSAAGAGVVGGSLQARRGVFRINSVASFSLSEEHAGCFGDWVLRVRIPLSKVLFYPGLCAGSLLQGEAEVIVLGGDCLAEVQHA